MYINDYQFGRITIEGEAYTQDVVIYPDRVQVAWRRADGHRLSPGDLNDVLEEKPETLIIGTGWSGGMKVPPETEDWLRSQGIKVYTKRTADAVKLYNSSPELRKTVAALHLTC